MTDLRIHNHSRITTGISGLDMLLDSGFPRGGVYIVTGPPGAGKTILGNQICFHRVQAGEPAVYITVLAENHDHMLTHLQDMAFYNPEVVGSQLHYFNGYSTLDSAGVPGLLQLIRGVLRDQRPGVLVMDGLAAAGALADTELDFKRFIHQLQTLAGLHNCVVLLLTHTTSDSQALRPEHTIVDGLIELTDRIVDLRPVREVQIRKLRGVNQIRGSHLFTISYAGITIYPRMEALSPSLFPQQGNVSNDGVSMERLAFDITELDAMVSGGLRQGSTTMVVGPTGSGKTILGLHFLAAGVPHNQRGLYVGFSETPAELVDKAARVGLDLRQPYDTGQLSMLWFSSREEILDQMAQQTLDLVRSRQIRRLVIDGLHDIRAVAVHHQRLHRFFTALTNLLREYGVTTLMSVETDDMLKLRVTIPVDYMSSLGENIMLLRTVEFRARLYRLISLLKMRRSNFDPSVHTFEITEHGLRVAATSQQAEQILAGVQADHSRTA